MPAPRPSTNHRTFLFPLFPPRFRPFFPTFTFLVVVHLRKLSHTLAWTHSPEVRCHHNGSTQTTRARRHVERSYIGRDWSLFTSKTHCMAHRSSNNVQAVLRNTRTVYRCTNAGAIGRCTETNMQTIRPRFTLSPMNGHRGRKLVKTHRATRGKAVYRRVGSTQNAIQK